MEKQELKELLKNIKDNNYAVPHGINPYDLSLVMMDYIGDTDDELRDDLLLYVLLAWIMKDVLTAREAYDILMIAMDENHILNGLGEISDKVFVRTFSVELVPSIIYKHKESIPENDILKVFNTVLKFYDEDKDVRGAVNDKSWAHGAAHGADALCELSQCEVIGYEDLPKILDSIYRKVTIDYYGYIHTEDDRMISAVLGVLDRKVIPIKEIEDWIKRFTQNKTKRRKPSELVLEFNINTFLKSLYFRLVSKEEYAQLADVVKDVIKITSPFNRA